MLTKTGSGVARLDLSPKAAYLQGRCREVVRLDLLPKAASLEGRCGGSSFLGCMLRKTDCSALSVFGLCLSDITPRKTDCDAVFTFCGFSFIQELCRRDGHSCR